MQKSDYKSESAVLQDLTAYFNQNKEKDKKSKTFKDEDYYFYDDDDDFDRYSG